MRQFAHFGLLLLAASLLVAQPVVPVSTFSIIGLNAKVASSALPDGIKTSLTSQLDAAQAAYVRREISATTGILNAFALGVAAQSGKLIPSDLASDLSLVANKVVLALQNGLRLGGSEVGTGGAILQVTDANSPALGTRLTIPPNALAAPVFISMTVPAKKPNNPILTLPGSGIALGP